MKTRNQQVGTINNQPVNKSELIDACITHSKNMLLLFVHLSFTQLLFSACPPFLHKFATKNHDKRK